MTCLDSDDDDLEFADAKEEEDDDITKYNMTAYMVP